MEGVAGCGTGEGDAMITKPEPTLDDLKWAIAKAETECPACGGAGGQAVPILDPETHQIVGEEGEGCSMCSGTGRVLRFPELREGCPYYCSHRKGYSNCRGLSYVPMWRKPEDLATWIRVLESAIYASFHVLQYKYDFWHSLIMGGNILGAFKAATEALGIEVKA